MSRSASIDQTTSLDQGFAAISPDATKLENLPFEEQVLLAKIKEIVSASMDEIETPAPGDSIEKPVVKIDESPKVQQVAVDAGIITEKNPADTMLEIEKRCQDELAKAKLDDDKPLVNYLIQMSQLVAEISTLLQQWTVRDNARTEAKKAEYTKASAGIEQNHYTKAGWTLALSVVSGAMGLWNPNVSLGFLQQSANEFLSAEGAKLNQDNSLALQILQKLSESSSTNNDLRQKALDALEAIKQWGLSASRHG